MYSTVRSCREDQSRSSILVVQHTLRLVETDHIGDGVNPGFVSNASLFIGVSSQQAPSDGPTNAFSDSDYACTPTP